MFKWPDEMKNPRFNPGDEVEYCDYSQVLTGFVEGEEVEYAKVGTLGTVVGFAVLSDPHLHAVYKVHFEEPVGVDCNGFTTGIEPKHLRSPKRFFVDTTQNEEGDCSCGFYIGDDPDCPMHSYEAMDKIGEKAAVKRRLDD